MTSTHPPAAAGAHDDGEVKSIKYFGVDVTPGEMRALNEIEAWDDETLRANQDCRSPHDQYIISLVRQKKTHDKDREAMEVREAAAVTARLEWLAATAPARAAKRRLQRERERADRARAPPATRSSEERKRQRETLRARMQFLGELGGKRPPPPTQPPGVEEIRGKICRLGSKPVLLRRLGPCVTKEELEFLHQKTESITRIFVKMLLFF